ncbi:MAG TPA: translation elongation factor 4 [Candidatus Krumholzibacteria bacterium]|nr:translation elongation factor 4 [Candidatus Krumholzibacteria bacterium]HRX50213.1 translation elongation factor 4 [Candidatus Krumholzibacteria bacterium]
MDQFRNFCIIAHIDHGKSTLADRLLELTGTLSGKQLTAQVLDSMELEQERGITIKSHPIRMDYKAADGTPYVLNLIDTPGHVDFHYEVSRSLAACEGALLVVDAVQGIQAQTINNLYLALEHDLAIIPVINKIDLPAARADEVTEQVVDLLGCEPEEVVRVSAKTGEGVAALLEHVVAHVPPPAGDPQAPTQALIFDSIFDPYVGAVAYVRVMHGRIAKGQRVRLMNLGVDHEVGEIGWFRLTRMARKELSAGEVGYIATGAKDVRQIRVGDTLTMADAPCAKPLAGYEEAKPMVFSGFYPVDNDQYDDLKDALQKMQLNDAALTWELEKSAALGFGFRCGFLGLLHMEIIQERLEREYDLNLIATLPNVEYEVATKTGETVLVENPAFMPPVQQITEVREPYVRASVITPKEYIGPVIQISLDRRGTQRKMEYIDTERVTLDFDLPLSELVVDYYDKLKSVTRGYASLDYEYTEHRPGDLIKLDIMINGEPVDALACIVHREKAYHWGLELCRKLKELIPRQMFQVAIQAAIGTRVVARTNVQAYRKNVTAKCYGGDITRKRKLLEKQKEGKKRMKQVGSVEIPQEAFMAVLKVER